jgi:hypothetical protein
MLPQRSLLVSLVLLIEQIPWALQAAKRKCGRPKAYADRLILKALLIRKFEGSLRWASIGVLYDKSFRTAVRLRSFDQ